MGDCLPQHHSGHVEWAVTREVLWRLCCHGALGQLWARGRERERERERLEASEGLSHCPGTRFVELGLEVERSEQERLVRTWWPGVELRGGRQEISEGLVTSGENENFANRQTGDSGRGEALFAGRVQFAHCTWGELGHVSGKYPAGNTGLGPA